MSKNSLDLWNNLFNKQDQHLQPYLMIRSPVAPALILFCYVIFTYKIGPTFMKNRKPYVLKNLMLCYNLIQIIINGLLVYWVIMLSVEEQTKLFCPLISEEITPKSIRWAELTLWYYYLKIFDLTDTIFMILRKKQNQTSYLHTYHHVSMVYGTWLACRGYPGGPFVPLGLINSLVHALMYSYYMLSAWDARFSQNITLKKSITIMQLIQHAFFNVYYSAMLWSPNCSFPKEPLVLLVPNTFIMTYLFARFYFDNYIKKSNKTKSGKLQ